MEEEEAKKTENQCQTLPLVDVDVIYIDND